MKRRQLLKYIGLLPAIPLIGCQGAPEKIYVDDPVVPYRRLEGLQFFSVALVEKPTDPNTQIILKQ